MWCFLEFILLCLCVSGSRLNDEVMVYRLYRQFVNFKDCVEDVFGLRIRILSFLSSFLLLPSNRELWVPCIAMHILCGVVQR
jgi:hypothetical protein